MNAVTNSAVGMKNMFDPSLWHVNLKMEQLSLNNIFLIVLMGNVDITFKVQNANIIITANTY